MTNPATGRPVSTPELAIDEECTSWVYCGEEETVSVGIAEGAVVREGVLRTSGLGSCVAVAIIEADSNTGGLIHPMLPVAPVETDEPGRYVDTALTDLFATLDSFHPRPGQRIAYVVGGATMFDFQSDVNGSIGDRNVSQTLKTLDAAGVTIEEQITGGAIGRSLTINTVDGTVDVRTAGYE